MELQPVKSSNVAAVGWLEGRLTVQFRDGGIYEGECSQETFEALLKAPSPGKFLYDNFHGAKLWKVGEVTSQSGPSDEGEKPEAGPTVSHAEDSCCGKPISEAIARGELKRQPIWFCPRCGARWLPNDNGSVVFWDRADADFTILRGRRTF